MKRIQILIIGSAVLVTAFILWPLPASLRNGGQLPAVRITDRNGALLYEVRRGEGLNHPLALTDVPPSLISALVASEDRTFFMHPGVSLRGTVRALVQNVLAMRVVSGGSTITQQLVRNLIHPEKRTFMYKVYEAMLAFKLERVMSKDDVLETYLNTAYFGHQSYGISAAAKTYFARTPSELSLAQSALLVGLLQSPTSYDPFENIAEAKRRQRSVLQAMVTTGNLSEEQREDALSEPIVLARDRVEIAAPHFVMWLLGNRPELSESESPEVRTTLDRNLQTEIEGIVSHHLGKLADRNVTSAAVVVLDARSGDILAMLGSADYFNVDDDGAVNVAVSARQPGSALKPFTYALALSDGMTAATTVADIETQFFTQEGNPYIPRNYDYGYHGLVRLREALANSYNIAAVRVLEKVGVPRLLRFLQQTGLTTLTESPEHYGLALTLGDSEVKLLELAQAFGIFARRGMTLHARALLSDPVSTGERLLDPKVSWLIADILSDNAARLPEFGEGSSLSFGFPVAAKTGTTRNSRDNWTLGFTPDRIVGVWVGNADNSPMRDTSGVTGAGPIFHDAMLAAVRGLPRAQFQRPDGMVRTTVCRLSGKLPAPECPHVIDEWFIAGTEPTEPDDVFRAVRIDRRNGLLATDACTTAHVVTKTFAVFPPQLQKWARENGWPQAPSDVSPLCGGSTGKAPEISAMSITRPGPQSSFFLDPLVPDRSEKVIFEARASADVRTIDWYVNGTRVGRGESPDFRYAWSPTAGHFRLEAVSGNFRDSLSFEVIKNN